VKEQVIINGKLQERIWFSFQKRKFTYDPNQQVIIFSKTKTIESKPINTIYLEICQN